LNKIRTQEKFFFLLFIVLIFIYWPRGIIEFLRWDDLQHIRDNPYLNPLSLDKVISLWGNQYGHLYIPLTYTIWAVFIAFNHLFGIGAQSPQSGLYIFLFSNILIHFINTLLVYQFIDQLLRQLPQTLLKTQAKYKTVTKTYMDHWSWPAFCGALIFSLHPIQVESVAWMSGFKEIIWVTFALLSINRFLSWLSNTKNSTMLYTSFFIGLASILCKPTAIVLPLIYLLLYVNFSTKKWQGAWIVFAKSLAFFLPFALITKYLQPDESLQFYISFPEKLLIVIDTLIFYLWKIILPLSLTPDYGRRPDITIQSLNYLLILAAIISGIAVSYQFIYKKKSQVFTLSSFFFIIPLLPVLGLISFGFQNYSTVADRYVYFPLVGIAMIVAFGLQKIENLKTIHLMPFLILTLVWVGLDYRQSLYWKNNETLFTYTLKVNPSSYMAENNLGQIDFEKGNIQKAKERFERSLKLNPVYTPAKVNYGAALFSVGQKEESVKVFTEALKLDPGNLQALMNIGLIKLDQRLYDEAIPYLNSTVKENPAYPEGWNNLGIAYIHLKQFKIAVECFQRAVLLAPERESFQKNLKLAQDDLAKNP